MGETVTLDASLLAILAKGVVSIEDTVKKLKELKEKG